MLQKTSPEFVLTCLSRNFDMCLNSVLLSGRSEVIIKYWQKRSLRLDWRQPAGFSSCLFHMIHYKRYQANIPWQYCHLLVLRDFSVSSKILWKIADASLRKTFLSQNFRKILTRWYFFWQPVHIKYLILRHWFFQFPKNIGYSPELADPSWRYSKGNFLILFMVKCISTKFLMHKFLAIVEYSDPMD